MLSMTWYLEHPIDFEYKNYILLDYIQSIDKSYKVHQLSPYLLYTEKLIADLKDFESKRLQFHKDSEKSYLLFEGGTMKVIKKSVEVPESIKTILEIINYSSPILESKVKLGYKLLGKYPQILF